MCILELSKALMYEFYYEYIKNNYDSKSKVSFTDTDSLMYEIKTEDVYQDFSSDKEMFDFSDYSTKSKDYDISNKLVIGKIKDETSGVAIKEFVGLEPKIDSFWVDNSEHKRTKDANRNVVSTIIHSEYKYVLLNNECIRHSINRIQSKYHRIGTYVVNEISLSCLDEKKNIYPRQWIKWISSWLAQLIRKKQLS